MQIVSTAKIWRFDRMEEEIKKVFVKSRYFEFETMMWFLANVSARGWGGKVEAN